MNIQVATDWDVEIQHRRTVLLNGMLLVAAVGGLLALILTYLSLPEGMSGPEAWIEISPFLAGWLVALVALLWRGLGYRTRTMVALFLTYALGVFIFARGGLPGSGRVWMLAFPILVFVLLGPRAGVWAGGLSVLTYLFFALVITRGWFEPLVSDDPSMLKTWIGEGGSFLLLVAIITLVLRSSNRGWLDALARVSTVNEQLQVQTRRLEEVNERLQRQTSQLQATAEIARVGSSILDPEALLTKAVDSIQDGFRSLGVYYVGLFQIEDGSDADVGGAGIGRFAVLKAATGEAGKLLLEMGHKVKLNEASTISRCVADRQACVASDVKAGTVQFDSLSMPHTRSEVALPLRSRGRIIGALNVHSTREESFGEADVAILQMVADQVAVTIDNARLFSQTERALKEVRAAQRRYLGRSWREFLAAKSASQVDYVQPGVESGNGDFLRDARRAAIAHGRAVAMSAPSPDSGGEPSSSQTTLVVPLKFRGQIIGTMALHEPRYQRPWTAQDIALAEAVAEQVGLTVENLRLMDETQRSAAHERLIGEISDQMQRATSVEDLMRIAAEELNQALGGSRAYVHLGTGVSLHPSEGDEQVVRGDS